MHVLKLDLNRSGPGATDTLADGPRTARHDILPGCLEPQENAAEGHIPQELWPPEAIARRMEARERELRRMLDDMRASIDHLRRDREALIGQLRDLGQPRDWPVQITGAGTPSAGASEDAGPGDRHGRPSARQRRRERRQDRRTEKPPVAPAAAPVSLTGTPPSDEPLATANRAAASSGQVSGAPDEARTTPDAAPRETRDSAGLTPAPAPLPRTPEEEFDALVQRLRTPAAIADTTVPQVERRAARRQQSVGPGRLVAIAATAALVVLGTPTVGHVEGEHGPTSLPSRARFLDVLMAPDLDTRPRASTSVAAAPSALRVELTTVRPAWIQAVIDDGWRIEQVVAGGVTIPVDGHVAISLILSDAGAVRLRVNGEDQGPAGDDGQTVARQFESSTVVTTTPSSPGNTPE